ncbi:MAG: TonB-dependent receptor, partial [Sinobacteraceae bacterium]|nr:TonB-dependent receptor [Nevskiaceae bacterium]
GQNAGLNSAAFLEALSPALSADNTSSLRLIDFKANRSLWLLPGGPLGVSLGAEYRRETLNAPPMPYTQTGDIIGWSYYLYRGEQKVGSLFTELNAPLLETLSVDAAGRVDKVWNVGTSVTPKLGFKWVPWKPLLLRGTYSKGFRAPNPAEAGKDNQFSGTLDMTGNGFLGIFRNTSNPNLRPEKSQMTSLGAVWEPWPGGSLDANFWWLRRTDEINSVDPFSILAGASGWPQAQVVKDAAGDVLEVSSPFENNSRSRLHDLDFTASQQAQVAGIGRLSAKVNWTYLASYRKTFDGGVTYEYAGTHGPMAVSGNTGTPKNRGNLSVGWGNSVGSVSVHVNFVDGFANKDNQQASCASSFADGSPAPPGCHIASFTTVDLHTSYKLLSGLEGYVSVTNLFDRVAPLDPSAYINFNFDPSMHLDGAIGRMFNVGLKYDFQ